MESSRFTESQIVAILAEADAGRQVKDLCRENGISPSTYYKWKSKYGGLEASELKFIKELEAENAELKRMYADASMECDVLKQLLVKKSRAARSQRSREVSGNRSRVVRATGLHAGRGGCAQRRLVDRLHARHAVRRPALPDAERAGRGHARGAGNRDRQLPDRPSGGAGAEAAEGLAWKTSGHPVRQQIRTVEQAVCDIVCSILRAVLSQRSLTDGNRLVTTRLSGMAAPRVAILPRQVFTSFASKQGSIRRRERWFFSNSRS